MATNFNIPEIGTEVTLAEDWTFLLYFEYRNHTLFEVLGVPFPSWRDRSTSDPLQVTIPKGTKLKVDRIYIRKGLQEFSSVTFLWPGRKTTKKKETKTATRYDGTAPPQQFTYTHNIPARGVRFWAKLVDVNKMQIEETVMKQAVVHLSDPRTLTEEYMARWVPMTMCGLRLTTVSDYTSDATRVTCSGCRKETVRKQ